MKKRVFALSFLAGAGAASQAAAESPDAVLPVVAIIGSAFKDLSARTTVENDAARLLTGEAGYAVASGGGLSGFPVVNGLADDRVKVRIDGMEIASSCGNHMNPPLSYLDPKQMTAIRLYAGVTPVSVGGDSIGATIEVQSAQPRFAAPGAPVLASGNLALTGRSVNDGVSAGVAVSVANSSMSMTYNGTQSQAHSYEAGGGEKVLASQYKSRNQSLLLAWRHADGLLTLRLGQQAVPYQGYPSQYMDMVEDRGRYANLGYEARLGTIVLDARVYWQDTRHEMGFFSPERNGMMPMLTAGRNRGYALKGEIPVGTNARLRLGNEYHAHDLHDYWPPMAGSMMMGPDTYLRINGGTRDRAVLFGEWEATPVPRWSTLLGVRGERVKSDTGAVQPYNTGMMNAADAMAAMAFNGRARARSDSNLDLTALGRFTPDAGSTYEFGLARKTRSPNLYERYTWGRGTMAMRMTNWFGDGNGYVGNLDLRPEVAYHASGSAQWQGGDGAWLVKVAPYYTRVDDFIDTDVVGSFAVYSVAKVPGTLLAFANHDARLYGINLSGHLSLTKGGAWGAFDLRGAAAFARGKRQDGLHLYRIMPPNATLTLEQRVGAWTNALEVAGVARKSRIDTNRLEPQTAGYTLVNLRSAWQAGRNARISAGVSNLFDKRHDLPLGGVYLSGLAASKVAPLRALPGPGRSLDLGLTVGF